MNDLDTLAYSFFQLFSRLEYALKAAGYHREKGRALEANWQQFASKANDSVLDRIRTDGKLSEAINFLRNYPPKKQVLIEDRISWKDSKASGICELDIALVYVRRVRNNLFHGGKFNGHWFEPQRSETLIIYSKTILLASMEAVAEVSAAYHG